MNTVDREQIRRFLELQYGTDKGTVWIGAGTKQNHAEVPFLWPEQVEEIVEYVATTNEAGHEVWYAAHLSYSKAPKPEGQGRAVKMSVKRRRLHFDIDRALTAEDTAKLTELQAWLVYSGTPGHVHAYIELNRSVDVATYHKFEDWLVTYFGSDTAVCRDNGLLRIPGTINCKPGAGSVTWDGTVSEYRWVPEELAVHIGLDLSVVPQATAQVASSAPIVAAPVSQVPQAIQYVLDNPKLKRDGTWDRSAMLATIVNAAASAGLTIAQTLGIALSRTELASKGENWIRTDVPRLWTKFGGDSLADEESRKQMQDEADTAALMGGQLDAFATKGSSPPALTTAKVEYKLRNAEDMAASAPPDWLCRDRIPRSAITMLIGDEGIGKSMFWVYLAAAITTGTALPEFGLSAKPGGGIVVLIITEDSWTTAVRPRLEAAGANLKNVRYFSEQDDGEGFPTFPNPEAMKVLQDYERDIDLIVVDTWLDSVKGNLDVKNGQHARTALQPWQDIAAEKRAAVLLLSHTNRTATNSARDKVGATSELRKKSRMVLWALKDENGNLVVGVDKSNYGRIPTAIAYNIVMIQLWVATEHSDGRMARLVCVGDTDRTVAQHLDESFQAGNDDAADKADCKKWLQNYMVTNCGAAPAKTAKAAGIAEGFSPTTVDRTKRKLGIQSKKQPDGTYIWVA
ncbi:MULTISPECIES: AAA family ATPase [unclassified Rhodococcus (in: high G+C Gram-positive bacteria)]|uniref:AAA family ATPase n=1 Tax=unclassified Rhodococcus (in: high G+C Gram-positive bacteria) TaxID=192944 RepID=UPI001AEB563D|nr:MULTISPECIES: AAA family ATPase [unclassified Rhodococcus (in: high G+C Gram-positive bacteria)]MBP2523572.1 hypothetical protein [Rhodococcus sp. PvP104]MDA3634747.1 AAA family ATPase [Rhodococcus sp. C-2]